MRMSKIWINTTLNENQESFGLVQLHEFSKRPVGTYCSSIKCLGIEIKRRVLVWVGDNGISYCPNCLDDKHIEYDQVTFFRARMFKKKWKAKQRAKKLESTKEQLAELE